MSKILLLLLIISCSCTYTLYNQNKKLKKQTKELNKYKDDIEKLLDGINDSLHEEIQKDTIHFDSESLAKEYPREFGVDVENEQMLDDEYSKYRIV